MKIYEYIIIGGGMAGSAAAIRIRKNDSHGSIAMFSREKYPPYNRPPLTKGLWVGKNIEDIMRPMENQQIDLYLDKAIIKISPADRKVIDGKGEEYHYQKLLIATGVRPVQIPNSPESLIYYRTLEDYYKLKELTKTRSNICVIGGGFVGSEIAAALIKQGLSVTMIFPEKGISGALFPDDLTEFLNDYYKEFGISVIEGHLVDVIDEEYDRFKLKIRDIGNQKIQELTFDGVVVGIGVSPNTKIAERAGLEVNDGIIVNEYLQTNDPNIFAAGDVANFINIGLGKRTRVEHEDNANSMGTLVGQNMSGKMEKYENFPFFYSDMFDLGYEALGDLNKSYDIFEDWIEPFKKGTIYYHQKGKIRGLVFWNLWGKIDQGRKMIQEGKIYSLAELQGFFTD